MPTIPVKGGLSTVVDEKGTSCPPGFVIHQGRDGHIQPSWAPYITHGGLLSGRYAAASDIIKRRTIFRTRSVSGAGCDEHPVPRPRHRSLQSAGRLDSHPRTRSLLGGAG